MLKERMDIEYIKRKLKEGFLKYIAIIFIIAIICFSPQNTYAGTITTAIDHSNGGYENCLYSNDRAGRATSFTADEDGHISSITFWAKKEGTPTNNLIVSITTNSSLLPTATVLGSGTLDASTLTGTLEEHTVDLDTPVSVTDGANYWVTFTCDSQNASNYPTIGISDTSGNPSAVLNSSWEAWTQFPYATFEIVPGGGGGGSVPSAAAGGGAPTAPSFNVVGASGTNQLAQSIGAQQQQPIQAYVVANNVTTAQALNRNIIESATIGG